MSRDISTDLETAIGQPVVRPFLAIRIELPDPVYVFTGRGALIFDDADGNSRTWVGAGDVGSIDTIGESSDGSATGVRVSLLDAPSDFRDDIADQATRGALFEVYVGALDEAFQQVTAVSLIWKGVTDAYKITDAGSTISVEITAESRAIDQRRPAVKRFTDEYQQRKHPGDKFFEYLPRMTEIQILWAQAELSGSSAAPISGGVGGGASGGGTQMRMPDY